MVEGCIVYEPLDAKSIRGTVLAISGLALAGNRDERLSNVCKSLASCGFRAIAPGYYDLNHLTISYKTLEDIVASIKFFTENKEFSSGKVSIFAPSFAAGMSMIAASNPEVRERVKAFCSVGGYEDAGKAIVYAMTQEESDEYGLWMMLYNFLYHYTGDNPRLKEALSILLHDNGLARNPPHYPEFKPNLRPDEAKLLDRLYSELPMREKVMRVILENDKKNDDLMHRISFGPYSSDYITPTVFIHGDKDNVIPPTESQILYDMLLKNNIPAHILITPLLTHGDTSMNWNMLTDAYQMSRAFGFFFHYACQ